MLRRLFHSRLGLRRRAALARGAEPRVLQSRSQEGGRATQHAFHVNLRTESGAFQRTTSGNSS